MSAAANASSEIEKTTLDVLAAPPSSYRFWSSLLSHSSRAAARRLRDIDARRKYPAANPTLSSINEKIALTMTPVLPTPRRHGAINEVVAVVPRWNAGRKYEAAR